MTDLTHSRREMSGVVTASSVKKLLALLEKHPINDNDAKGESEAYFVQPVGCEMN